MGWIVLHPLFYVLMTINQRQSYLFAALAILFWSTVSTAFKVSLNQLSPMGLLLISSFVATLFLGTYNLMSGPGFLANFLRNLRQSLFAGFLNPFLYYLVLFVAYDRLRAQEAQALNYTWAIILSLFSVLFLRERLRLKDLLALTVSLFGVVIISSKGQLLAMQFDDILGTGLALGSSFIWAAYWILSMKDKRPNPVKLFYNFLVGFMLITMSVFAFQVSILEKSVAFSYGLLGSVWVGIFEMGLTFLLWLKALQLTENTAKISNLIFLTPFVSMLFIFTILKEPIHPATIVGLLLIVLSNVFQKS
jgi:drug/metabolite transporter (DMT)-like permease